MNLIKQQIWKYQMAMSPQYSQVMSWYRRSMATGMFVQQCLGAYIKETSNIHITDPCEGNPLVTCKFLSSVIPADDLAPGIIKSTHM